MLEATGNVVFRKYFKIGLVRTSSSKGSSPLVKSRKHVKKSVKRSHVGIFALAFLILLFTVPSAFADEHDPDLAFNLMLSISDGQTDIANLEALIEDNNFTVDLSGYADALDEAAGLVAIGEYAAAQLVLDDAEIAHDDIYNQFYEQIEEQQDARFDEYVETAKSSLSFIIENGPALGLTQPVITQLATTLAIIEDGTDDQIMDATGGNSQIGITLSVLPNDLSLPSSFTTGSGLGEELKSKLPPGIAKKYGYTTDSDISTTSSDSEINDNGEDKLGFVDKKLEQGGLPDGFEKKVDGILSLASDEGAGDLPEGFIKKLGDDGEITAADLRNLPKGFLKKALGIDKFAAIFYGEDDSSTVDSSTADSSTADSFEDQTEDDVTKDNKNKKDKKPKKDNRNSKGQGNNGNGNGNNGNGNGNNGNGNGNGGGGPPECPPGKAKKGEC